MFSETFAQSSSYEGVIYRTPAGFKRHPSESALILVSTKGEKQSVITLFKPRSGAESADQNFGDLWGRLKNIDINTGIPTKTGPNLENGWSVIAGLSNGEYDGKEVAVMAISATANGRVIDLLIVSNIEEHSEQISKFINDLVLPGSTAVTNNSSAEQNGSSPPRKSAPGSGDLNGRYLGCFTWGYNFGSSMLVSKPGNIPQFTIGNGKYSVHLGKGGSVQFDRGIITFSGGDFDRWRAVVEILKDGSYTILFRSNRLQPRPAGQPHQVGDHQCYRTRE